jgi:hypothetical protein
LQVLFARAIQKNPPVKVGFFAASERVLMVELMERLPLLKEKLVMIMALISRGRRRATEAKKSNMN